MATRANSDSKGIGKGISEAAQIERREYNRRWRREHRDAVKRHNQTFWEKRAEQRLASRANQ